MSKGTGFNYARTGAIAGRVAFQSQDLFALEGGRLLVTVALGEEVTDVLRYRPHQRSQEIE